jgi:hypothetical protein
MSVIVASSPVRHPNSKTPVLREARPYRTVLRARPPSVGSCRETTRQTTTTMVQLANHHRVVSDTSSSAAATAQDHQLVRCQSLQPAPRLVRAELPTGAALRALVSTTAKTSERRCHRRQQRHFVVFSPVPARLRPRRPPQLVTPINPQRPLLLRPSPPQRLPRHPNNQQRRRRRRRLTTKMMMMA